MEFQDVVRKRRMVRDFKADQPVPRDVIDRILHNATRGPSAGFSQGQAFLVLEGEDLAKFWALRPHSNGVHKAPLLIVPFAAKHVYLDRYAQPDKGWTDRDEARWPVPFWHIDTGMATLLILQTVVDAGLGALYFGIMPDDVARFRELYGVPDEYEPIGAVAIGYSDEPQQSGSPTRRKRLPTDEVVHYGRW
ncbi:nitroreductase family protein [Actinophytocola sp.]|uniref:nitroreductase family protein n=1 Tax=Actinophytocola sp. TaxID=1872138 RepID=UPI002ED31F32